MAQFLLVKVSKTYLIRSRAGPSMKIFGNETNLEADYETQVVTSQHLHEYTRHVMKNAMIMPHLNI